MPIDVIRRQKALKKTRDKYIGKPFVWGETDCVKLARSHLVAMGHKPPKMPRYRDARGAVKALKASGHKNLAELFDSLLPRINPAEMLPGDIALSEGDGVLDCISVSAGHKVLTWHETAEGAVFITPHELKAAWRA